MLETDASAADLLGRCDGWYNEAGRLLWRPQLARQLDVIDGSFDLYGDIWTS